MSHSSETFVIGETALPVPGIPTPEERKSPPLREVTPAHENFYQIDPALYTSPDQVKPEWDRLWTKSWLIAGRVSDLAEVGAWLRFDVGRASVIVARSADDRISAFHNLCMHRGAQLVKDDFGKTSSFVCPYHSWRYDRTGQCKSVTDRDLFRAEALAGNLDIPQIRCEAFGGFVFINMDPNAQSLASYLGELPDLLKGYHLEDLIVNNDVMVELECNWKTILDAFSENYHVHMAHPAAAGIVNEREVQMDFYPNGHARRITPIGVHNSRKGAPGPVNPVQRMLLAGAGIDPDTFVGDASTVHRAIQIAKRAMIGRAAQVYAPLSDGQLTDDWAMNIFPNAHWSIHAEGLLLLEYLPHPTDPARCRLHILVLGHRGIDFTSYMPPANDQVEHVRPARIHTSHDNPGIVTQVGQLIWEDIDMTRRVQRGMDSGALPTIRLSEQEQVLRHQHAQISHLLETA